MGVPSMQICDWVIESGSHNQWYSFQFLVFAVAENFKGGKVICCSHLKEVQTK
jgi:hypothetical protein